MIAVVRWTGGEVRALRDALRMSVRDFAAHTNLSTASIADMEAKGEQAKPRLSSQRLLDEVLAAASEDARQRFCAMLGPAALRSNETGILDLPVPRPGEAALATHTRRHGGLLGVRGGVSPSSALPQPSSVEAADILSPTSPAHVEEVLAYLREQWHALVKTDNLLGPRFALASVLNQITVVEALRSILGDEQRLEVVQLGAKYAESAAWLFEEIGDVAQARYWTSRAIEWAYDGEDARMLAWTIFRRAQQAAAIPDAAQAIGLAQAARRNEERLATPTRAAIRVQEAYGHAVDGNERAAQRLLDEAHTWAASDIAGDAHEGHGSYCTPSYIEIQRANCWLTTGKPKKAIVLYEEGLPTLPVVYQRNRAAALSRLAVAYMADGQLEQAASTARAVLPVARSTGSTRIFGEIKGVSAKLASHRRLPDVAALLHELDAWDH